MTTIQVLEVAGAFLGILILCGGALALVRGSYSKARIQALREDNDDLRSRVEDLDRELDRRRDKITNQADKIEDLRSECRLLKELVTSKADVEAVTDFLEFHHNESVQAWELVRETILNKSKEGRKTE